MIGIKVNGEMADLYPGTQIQRERNNPFFLAKTSDGKDGIASEFSFPFSLPPTDKNLRLYGFPDHLPTVKKKVFDSLVYTHGMQLSYGKQILASIDSNMAKANVGKLETHFYSNSSEFFQRVKTKKLRDLQLGGNRTFNWAGYSRTALGFWKHVHDTWLYDNSDNGDYVFATVYNPGYTGTAEYMNLTKWTAGDAAIDPAKNVVSLCPQVYVKYVLQKVFTENGYTITGELLNDYDFKKLTMQSFYGVYWSDIIFSDDAENPVLIPTPRTQITINLAEHMDKDITCSEFVVELMKLLPIGFVINDNARTVEIVWLHKLSPAGGKDRTASFRPPINTSLGEGESSYKIVGLRRTVHSSDSWGVQTTDLKKYHYLGTAAEIPIGVGPVGDTNLVLWYNGYFASTDNVISRPFQFIGNNNNSYEPAGASEFIESNISFMPFHGIFDTDFFADKPGIHRPRVYYLPACNVEGFWYGKTDDLKNWGLRFMFYRGKKNYLGEDFDVSAPLLTSSAYTNNVVARKIVHIKEGNWSLSLTDDVTGLLQFWKKWLPVLGNIETLRGTLNMPLYEYLQLKWNDVLLVQNTPYIISKINEVLPYTGSIDIEAVRMIY